MPLLQPLTAKNKSDISSLNHIRFQHIVITIVILLSIHVIGLMIYTQYSRDLALETNRDLVVNQMQNLIGLLSEEKNIVYEKSFHALGEPYLTFTLDSKPFFAVQIDEQNYFELGRLLANKPLQVSYKISGDRWMNITGRTITHAAVWQIMLLIIEGLVAAILLAVLWFVRKIVLTLLTINNAVSQIGFSSRPVSIPHFVPSVIRQALEGFNAMQNRLQELLRERSKMLAAISHDLRTPIARIRMRIEQMPDDEGKTRNLQNLTDMEIMLKQLGQYAKHDYALEPATPVDIHSLLQTLCDDFNEPDRLTFTPYPQRLTALLRLSLFKRAIQNLISNALEYGQNVTVSTEKIDEHLVIVIEDDGPGIERQHLPYVMEPFYRVDSARKVEKGHVGLGLAIVKEIVTAHQGTFSLENKIPHGLRATILL